VKVVYCDKCGYRIAGDPLRPGSAEFGESGKKYCAKCAPMCKSPTTEPQATPPSKVDVRAASGRKSSQRLNAVSNVANSTVQNALQRSDALKMQSVDDHQTGESVPAKSSTKFYFCETCGKRVTDVEIEQGDGRDKKLKGFYCKDCAIGVNTIEFPAMKNLSLRESPPMPASDHTHAQTGLPITRSLTKSHGKSNDKIHAHGAKNKNFGSRRTILKLAIIGALSCFCFLIVFKACRPTKDINPEANSISKSTLVDSKPSSVQVGAPPLPKDEMISPSLSTRKTDTVDETPRPEAETQARADYYRLVKFDGLAERDTAGRIAAIEMFLQEHGNCAFADPARLMLEMLKKPVPSQTEPATNDNPVQAMALPAKIIPPVVDPISAATATDDAAQRQAADVLTHLSFLLRENKLDEADKLLNEKLQDPALVAVSERLRKEKSDLSEIRAIRQRAVDALRTKTGIIALTIHNTRIMGTLRSDPNRADLALALHEGPEMTIKADQLTVQDVDVYTPLDTSAGKANDLRQRGLLYLAAGDTVQAERYFVKARDAGLGSAITPYLERIAALKLDIKEAAAAAAWKKAEGVFANKNWKAAKETYDAFQHDFAGTAALANKGDILKTQLDIINEALSSPKALSLNLDGAKLELVQIQSGEFMMGSNDGDANEKPVHKVKITKSFYMGKYVVTQAQYEKVMSKNPSKFKGDDLPVDSITYGNAKEFCQKASELTGKSFRLPTEAEWEYACRAGTSTKYNLGDGIDALEQAGWHSGNSQHKTHAVGQKRPNAWGLFDMHGNVWQWCQDWFGEDFYTTSPVDDPQGATMGINGAYNCVLRGGSWYYNSGYCRSAFRMRCDPNVSNVDFGFRVVVSVARTP